MPKTLEGYENEQLIIQARFSVLLKQESVTIDYWETHKYFDFDTLRVVGIVLYEGMEIRAFLSEQTENVHFKAYPYGIYGILRHENRNVATYDDVQSILNRRHQLDALKLSLTSEQYNVLDKSIKALMDEHDSEIGEIKDALQSLTDFLADMGYKAYSEILANQYDRIQKASYQIHSTVYDLYPILAHMMGEKR